MQTSEQKLQYTVKQGGVSPVPVIVVAAGSSRRMGGVNKQTLEICGIPVIIRTLTVFEKCPLVSNVILVTRTEDIFLMQSLCAKYNINKVSDIVEGGENRHKSVLCGIARLSPIQDKALIHDGARPFVTEDIIRDCIAALDNAEGSLCAVKISDTVKQAGSLQTVEKTVDRTSLYLAQTPQGIRVKPYLEAASHGGDFTDDASVLESAGCRVQIVGGDSRNIKITTPADVTFAEGMINGGLV